MGMISAAACGSSDAKLEPDAAPMADAQPPPPAPMTTVSVSTKGNDAADGVTAPVKTIARAFEIAKTNGAITAIKIAAGRYSAANGEVYPQLVPADVKVEGSSDGGVVLVGDRSGPGLTLDSGELANLSLEDFSVALTATRTGKLTSIVIRSSGVGLRVEQSASLDVAMLQITGAAQACATGIQLVEHAQLRVDHLVTQTLGAHVDTKDQASLAVANAQVTADPACTQALFTMSGSGLHSIASSTFEGGRTAVLFLFTQPGARAILTDTTIKNAQQGLSIVGGQVSMTRGTLANNIVGANVVGGAASFQGVAITDNRDIGIDAGAALEVSGSTVTGNVKGIRCSGGNLFNNTIQNSFIGVEMPDGDFTTTVTAIGNTWIPGAQGADADGHYASMEIRGPATGPNFSLGRFGILRF